jgi:hypothetical protein
VSVSHRGAIRQIPLRNGGSAGDYRFWRVEMRNPSSQTPTESLDGIFRSILMRSALSPTVAGIMIVAAIVQSDDRIVPSIELQSGPLTPGLVLGELREPIHQVRLLVDLSDGKGKGRGTLILDPNTPEFDEFGRHVGGLDTPYVKRKGGPLRPVELDCEIAFVKEEAVDQDTVGKWSLYRLRGPKLSSTLYVATLHSILEGGPARLVVIENEKVKSVVDLTRFGLVRP